MSNLDSVSVSMVLPNIRTCAVDFHIQRVSLDPDQV